MSNQNKSSPSKNSKQTKKLKRKHIDSETNSILNNNNNTHPNYLINNSTNNNNNKRVKLDIQNMPEIIVKKILQPQLDQLITIDALTKHHDKIIPNLNRFINKLPTRLFKCFFKDNLDLLLDSSSSSNVNPSNPTVLDNIMAIKKQYERWSETIPNSLIEHICSFLGLKDFIRLLKLNKHWKTVLYKSTYAWSNFIINIDADKTMAKYAIGSTTCQFIKKLSIDLDDDVIENPNYNIYNFKQFTNVTCLDLKLPVQIEDHDMADEYISIPTLKEILSDIISNLKSLKEVEIVIYDGCTWENIYTCLELMKHLKITKINLKKKYLGVIQINQLTTYMNHTHTLLLDSMNLQQCNFVLDILNTSPFKLQHNLQNLYLNIYSSNDDTNIISISNNIKTNIENLNVPVQLCIIPILNKNTPSQMIHPLLSNLPCNVNELELKDCFRVEDFTNVTQPYINITRLLIMLPSGIDVNILYSHSLFKRIGDLFPNVKILHLDLVVSYVLNNNIALFDHLYKLCKQNKNITTISIGPGPYTYFKQYSSTRTKKKVVLDKMKILNNVLQFKKVYSILKT